MRSGNGIVREQHPPPPDAPRRCTVPYVTARRREPSVRLSGSAKSVIARDGGSVIAPTVVIPSDVEGSPPRCLIAAVPRRRACGALLGRPKVLGRRRRLSSRAASRDRHLRRRSQRILDDAPAALRSGSKRYSAGATVVIPSDVEGIVTSPDRRGTFIDAPARASLGMTKRGNRPAPTVVIPSDVEGQPRRTPDPSAVPRRRACGRCFGTAKRYSAGDGCHPERRRGSPPRGPIAAVPRRRRPRVLLGMTRQDGAP